VMFGTNYKSGQTNYLLRAAFLGILLVGVGSVIIVAMRGLSTAPATVLRQQEAGAGQSGRTATLFEQFVTSGGWIVWFILLPMSFLTVYLAVEYSLTIRQKLLIPAGVADEIVQMAQELGPAQFVKGLADRDDLVSRAVANAVAKGGADWFRMREAFFESLQEQATDLSRRIEWVNLIGNVSPMVGLFGTVVGMIQLFNAIVVAGGQPQPAQLAGGISVALVTTFWGLLIAIPALTVYGIFRNRIETLVNLAVTEGENILPKIRRIVEKQRVRQQSAAAVQKQAIHDVAAKPARDIRQATPLR